MVSQRTKLWRVVGAGAMALTLAFLAACSDTAGPPVEPSMEDDPVSFYSNAAVQDLIPLAFGSDREMLEINARVPGFAGVRVSANGELVTRLTPRGNAENARAVLTERLPARLTGRAYRTESATYEFNALFRWRGIAATLVSDLRLVSLGVSEGKGKLVVGIEELERFE